MIEIDPRDFRVVSRSSDGGGRYVAAVSADGEFLFRAILDATDRFQEGWVERLVEVAQPADLDWAEWEIVPNYGSTPDYADVDLILLDGKTYRAEFAEDVYLVGVEEGEPVVFAPRVEHIEGAALVAGDRVCYTAGNGRQTVGTVAATTPLAKYPHILAVALVGTRSEFLIPARAGRSGAYAEVVR